MYTLTLKNFKCFEDRTIQFPSQGLVLLSAPSGSGKSTLMNGFLYAIGGSVKKMSKKNVHVSLSLTGSTNNFVITRTGTKVDLIRDDGKWNGSEAQVRIDAIFPHFKGISYIDQLLQYNFTAQSPADKTEFLRSLLLEEHQVELVEDKIKKDMDVLKDEITKMGTRCEMIQGMMVKVPPPTPLTIDVVQITPVNVNHFIEIQVRKGETLTESIRAEKVVSKAWMEQQQAQQKLQVALELEKSFVDWDFSQIPALKEWLKKWKSIEGNMNRRKFEDTLATRVASREKELTEIKGKLHPISLPELRECKSLLTVLKTLPQTDEGTVLPQITTCKEELALVIELIQESEVLTCPECDTTLHIEHSRSEGKSVLVKRKHCGEESRETLVARKSCIEKKLSGLQTRQGRWESDRAKYNETSLKLEKFSPQVRAEIDMIITEMENITSKISAIEQDTYIKELKKSIKNLPPAVEFAGDLSGFNANVAVEKTTLLSTLDGLLPRYNEMKRSLSTLRVDAPRVDWDQGVKMERLETELESVRKNVGALSEWDRVNQAYAKFQRLGEDHVKLSGEKEIKMKSMKDLDLLKSIMKKAEGDCFDEFIKSLDVHAASYLDEVFEEPIRVQLNTTKELKNGNEKRLLNFQLFYKAIEAGDITELSGGEYARVNLCYALALSEMMNNRVLLLDECLASLDMDTCARVIDMLNEKGVAKNSLVLCVAHQCIEGNFDSILKL